MTDVNRITAWERLKQKFKPKQVYIGVDYGSPLGDRTVEWYMKDGKIFITNIKNTVDNADQ